LHSSRKVDRLVFGTVVRNAPVQQGGELVLMDWGKKSVVKAVPIFPDNPRMDDDPNPRGNTRGCKGIAVVEDEIVAANFHTLQIFDQSLNHRRDISHGLMVGTHEIYSDGGNHLWLSSTVIDAALQFDLKSGELINSFFPREMKSFQDSLALQPSGIDRTADNRRKFLNDDHLESSSHLHLNAVTAMNGDVYALFHALGAICNLSTGNVVLQDKNLVRSHNLVFLEDDILVANDTYRQTVRIYDLTKREQINAFELSDFSWVRRLRRLAEFSNLPGRLKQKLGLHRESISRPIFVRGLARRDNLLFIGLSPASILCIDWHSGELLDAYQYSNDPRVCVHGLALLP